MKKLCSIILIAAMMMSLTACGKFTCSLCGDEVSSGKTVEIMGEKTKVCNTCYKDIKELQDAFK